MLLRPMGNLTFGQLHDETGEMQFMISRRDLPEDHVPGYKPLTKLLDIGEALPPQPARAGFPGQRADRGLAAG